MVFNNDFKFDLKVGQEKENLLAKIIQSKKLEVKYDRAAQRTGNVFVEFESRGKPSGIATTEAEYFCFCVVDSFYILPTKKLKKLCRDYLGTKNERAGGDNNTSKGILLPIKKLLP